MDVFKKLVIHQISLCVFQQSNVKNERNEILIEIFNIFISNKVVKRKISINFHQLKIHEQNLFHHYFMPTVCLWYITAAKVFFEAAKLNT